MVFFPEYHLKWQGLFQKGRSGTTLNCMCLTLAQLSLRPLNCSQGTHCELLGLGGGALCTGTQVVHCPTRGGTLLMQTCVLNCMTCGGWPPQNPGHNGRHPGNPGWCCQAFYPHESNAPAFLPVINTAGNGIWVAGPGSHQLGLVAWQSHAMHCPQPKVTPGLLS